MLMTRLVRTWEALDLLTNKLKLENRSIILLCSYVDTIILKHMNIAQVSISCLKKSIECT